MKKCIHYINQFFAGLGGEDTADLAPELREGPVGPGVALNNMLDDCEVTYTIVCGDNYIGENKEQAVKEILALIEDKEFDLFVAGPAFQAGRYGVACGMVCEAVEKAFNVPALTSMNAENPGVEMFRKKVKVFKGGNSAAKMRQDLDVLTAHANKLLKGETGDGAEKEGYFPRGVRHQVWLEKPIPAAVRGVEMLVKKLNGQPYETELFIEPREVIEPAKPIKDLKKARIALVNTGGIVPVDNPDRIQSASATRWGRYDISEMPRLLPGEFKTIHAGFDPAAANADPNVIMPVDVMKDMLEEEVYGSLHPYFYSTVGTGTTQAEASRMGQEILEHLEEDKVDGVLLVAT